MSSPSPSSPENPYRPEMRIGDPERRQAFDLLADRFANGYLTPQEFEDRTSQAAVATQKAQLDALLADLPAMGSQTPVGQVASGEILTASDLDAERELEQVRKAGRRVQMADSVIWSVAIIVMFVGIFTSLIPAWWIAFPVAAVASWGARAALGLGESDEKVFEKMEKDKKRERKERIERAYERRKELGQ